MRGKFILPAVVLAFGAALSIALGLAARQEISRSAHQRFDAVAIDVARKVEGRLDNYVEVLAGLRARFNTQSTLTRGEFRDYVEGLNLAKSHPGFRVVNYAPHVMAADKQRFEEQLRRDASLDTTAAAQFAIKPPGEREDYYPLTFIEPLRGNEKLLGMDLGAMPNRGNALEQARDTGGLVTSGRKIRIAGRESEVGLAMRLPVYRPHMPLDTVVQRRAAYLGSVGAGFSVADMMRDVIDRQAAAALRFRLIDLGPSPDAIGIRVESRFVAPGATADSQLLFDNAASQPAAGQAASAAGASTTAGAGAADPAPRFERSLAFKLGGHAWRVEVGEDERQIVGRLDAAIPWLIVLGGLAISTLLAGIGYSLATARTRAQALATVMTRHLRASERQLAEAQRLASLGSWILDAGSGALVCSEEAKRILGFGAGRVLLDLPALLSRVPAEERAVVEQHVTRALHSGQRGEFEHHLSLPDGTERWVHVIVQLSDEGGQALLHGTVRDDTQRRKGAIRLKLEHEIARLLIGDGPESTVLPQALEAVCTHLRWDCGALWSLGPDARVRCSAAWHAADDPAVEQFIRISRSLDYRPDEGSLGRAWTCGDAVRIEPLAAGHDFTRDALAGQAGLAVGLILPMATAGTTTALEFFSRDPSAADADALESLRVIALQIAQYEQRKEAERSLRFVANHDSLTGLSNRASLQRDMARAIKRSNRHRKRFAVMFIDLDRFKHINDTLGHGVGDAMIKACAERLTGMLRGDDAVARFGGDEFVLVLENLSSASDAAVLAEKALACCAEPFVVDGRELHVSASIGVSIFPEDGTDAETLLKNADTAMYRAKDKGCGTYGFYAAQMNAQGSERLMLESGLRRALERGELELHYQPKMNLHSQAIVGVEALMRWRHPTLGLVPPTQFIPIAEEIGLIESLGKWALAKACSDARAWQACGLPAVQMSVNLSPRQLSSRTLIADIGAILQASGLDPTLLELEITEGAMMNNPEHAVALLQEIRDMGVGLAIDDFGTGYSSLSYLKRFPLSTVKIDRTFINDLPLDADAQALTDGIITLAHGLRLKVVAEGVETAAQLAYLRIRGCDEIQGYWLCKPVPADEVCQFMARHMRNQFASPVAA
ncbi:bifunctional diguanylate cyclase/phosphodiesterase [Aquabacterium sp.]|uniref:bifunctional diguanylate cyclase/phosphodiesterase n=1 Tax=Aquabacterium sp. TaxID=1872578 RepID=UPI002C9F3D9B|nr:EAL domain-containing protein [Aquabacterium sp.]HSW08377.1 EAL domain-containing protein [Aquabacterium sp.]